MNPFIQKSIPTIYLLLISFVAKSQMAGSGNALSFDGSDDYVNCGTGINISGSSFTFEVWAKRSSTSLVDIHLFSLGSPSNNEGLHVRWQSNGTLRFGFWNNDFDVSGVNIDLNWHHYAFTYNAGTNTKTIYVDGKNVGSNNSNPDDFVGTGKLKIGVLVDGFGSGNEGPWYGEMDEIRVWNTELSQTQIRDWMCKKLSSSHSSWSNLQAYYNSDTSSGTTLKDRKNSNNGTLTNGPSWVTSGAQIGNESSWLASVSSSSTISLSHSLGFDLSATITAGTAELMQVYRIDQAPNNSTPPSPYTQLSITGYFGVKLYGSSGGTYTVVLNYDGHPGIVNEANLRLAKRNDNTSAWSADTTATLNQTSNTLTLSGQTGTEFILGSTSLNPLPIVLLNFEAKPIDDFKVELMWSTIMESDNDYFEIERSIDGMRWETIGKIDAIGYSESVCNYSFIDGQLSNTRVYYRLKQYDVDGKTAPSNVIAVNPIALKDLQLYPNPATEFLIISNIQVGTKIILVDCKGKAIHTSESEDTRHIIHLEKIHSGIYSLQLIYPDKSEVVNLAITR